MYTRLISVLVLRYNLNWTLVTQFVSLSKSCLPPHLVYCLLRESGNVIKGQSFSILATVRDLDFSQHSEIYISQVAKIEKAWNRKKEISGSCQLSWSAGMLASKQQLTITIGTVLTKLEKLLIPPPNSMATENKEKMTSDKFVCSIDRPDLILQPFLQRS